MYQIVRFQRLQYLKGTRQPGVKSILIVGGAGTLFVKSGLRLVDMGTIPEVWLPGVKSLGEFYLNSLMKESEWNRHQGKLPILFLLLQVGMLKYRVFFLFLQIRADQVSLSLRTHALSGNPRIKFRGNLSITKLKTNDLFTWKYL